MSDTCIFIYYVSSCRGKSVWYIFSYSANALILQWTPEPPPAKKKKKQQKKSLLSGFGAAWAQEEHDVSYLSWLKLRQAHFWSPSHFSVIYFFKFVKVRLRSNVSSSIMFDGSWALWYIYITCYVVWKHSKYFQNLSESTCMWTSLTILTDCSSIWCELVNAWCQMLQKQSK